MYLLGASLGKIANAINQLSISSPTGNSCWTRDAINRILSNTKYAPEIITETDFWKVQIEKERRSNISAVDISRKEVRFRSCL
jgi:hypothetical protein